MSVGIVSLFWHLSKNVGLQNRVSLSVCSFSNSFKPLRISFPWSYVMLFYRLPLVLLYGISLFFQFSIRVGPFFFILTIF